MSAKIHETPIRHGGDKRGSAASRRARKTWMLSEEAGFGGDGVKVACVHGGEILDFSTVEADRKDPMGPYARWNVQPSCAYHNKQRSNNINWVGPLGR